MWGGRECGVREKGEGESERKKGSERVRMIESWGVREKENRNGEGGRGIRGWR